MPPGARARLSAEAASSASDGVPSLSVVLTATADVDAMLITPESYARFFELQRQLSHLASQVVLLRKVGGVDAQKPEPAAAAVE